jgi:hypothetical protein
MSSEHRLIKFGDDDPVELTPELRFWLQKVNSLMTGKDIHHQSDEWVIDQLSRSPYLPPIEAWLFLASRIGQHRGWAEERFDDWHHPATELDYIWQAVLDRVDPVTSEFYRNFGEPILIDKNQVLIKAKNRRLKELLEHRLKKFTTVFCQVMGRSVVVKLTDRTPKTS